MSYNKPKANGLIKFILIGILSCCGNNLFAQQPLLDTLSQKFQLYRERNLQEKLYVHLDRTSFITGETLWFRVYCVNGTTHHRATMSKVAYIEILNRNQQPVIQSKVELHNGDGTGSLFIPASVNSENYTVRAYTNWMKNFDAEFYFHQPITIVNPFRDPEKIKTKIQVRPDAQFLPEGGCLVNGMPATIAYRVTDASGKGIRFKGSVINSLGDTLARFEPIQFGLGSFSMIPSASETYTIVIRGEDETPHTFPFPQVHTEGYTLNLERDQDKISIHIAGKFKNLSPPLVYLFVHARNQVTYSEMHYLNDQKTTFTLNEKSFTEGISHITLFNADLQPVCERLFFKTPDNFLHVKINSDNAVYDLRRKVKLSIHASDSAGLIQNASLSLSVFKSDSLPLTSQKDILSYLLLTSDLRGEIESPESYFKPGADKLTDLLMLTHGWRRFLWDKVFLSQPGHTYLPELQGHLIKGKVLDQTGNPSMNVKTFLAYPSKKINLSTAISNRAGEVHYILKDFKGAQEIILQTNLSEDSIHTIAIENPFSSSYANLSPRDFILKPSSKRGLSLRSVAMQVQDIFQQDEDAVEQLLTSALADSSAFYGKADETYFLDKYTRFRAMEEVMREYVSGVWVRKRKGRFHFMALDKIHDRVFNEDPLVLMDGVPVFDVHQLMAFDPFKVKKLEVITRPYFLGNMTFQGIVSYSTYSGDLAGYPIHPKSTRLDYEGLQQKREFYSPLYETEKKRSSRIPDQRHLLYWLPVLDVKNGVAEAEFYTSDLAGDFVIQVQGLSDSGLMGSASHQFTVKRFDQ
jgi:hypothetical protein